MTKKRRIIFRADGNNQIGLGHVVRSLALAAMLRDTYECVFAIQAPSAEIKAQLMEVCAGVIILPTTATTEERFTHELSAYLSDEEIVVLDGYHFGTSYQQQIKAIGAMLVCIDDIHAYAFVADAIINQSGGVQPTDYKTALYTKLYLGPAYALLRPPFLVAAGKARSLPKHDLRLLINLGGADPQNLTLKVANELRAIHASIPLEIVIGAAYRHQVELQRWLHCQSHIVLHQNLNARQMRDLMQNCAMALTSASGVAYEYAAVGGVLFVEQTADNQEDLYRFLTVSGIAKAYHEMPQFLPHNSFETRFTEQVATQRHHFDGGSKTRLSGLFTGLSLRAGLQLRKVTKEDLQLQFDWANDPQVRQNSFHPEPIPLETHTRWFNNALEDSRTLLYIAEADGAPAANIRFNITGTTAVISYLIAAEFRGKGLGHTVLQKGIKHLRASRPDITSVQGLIQKGNIASIKSFEKAGFIPGTPNSEYPEALLFEVQLR